MSAAKRLKISSQGDGSETRGSDHPPPVKKKPGVTVDLSNGSDDPIVQERWQKFKDELYQSEFWQQYREKIGSLSSGAEKKAYKDVVEREIQRAWDESEKGKSLRMPEMEGCNELKKGSSQAEVGDPTKTNSVVGEQKDTAMGQSGWMQRYLVTVEYAGTRFLGWQKQKHRPDLRTVQGTLEDAFIKFIGQPVVCGGSSRTDTGVHALANVCHIDAERVSKRKPGEYLPPHEPEVVKRAINHFLLKDGGGDMMVVNVRCVPLDFHARFQARERTYHYRVVAGNPFPSIFERDRAWNVPENLNLAAMQEAAQVLIGHHDFSSFRATGCQAKSPVKTLDELHICEMPAWPCFPSLEERRPYTRREGELDGEQGRSADHDLLLAVSARPRCFVITARARSFLYHQVHLLVGTLKAVGCGMLTADDVRRILNARSIKATPAMAPAHGLYLAEVKYDFENPKTRSSAAVEPDFSTLVTDDSS